MTEAQSLREFLTQMVKMRTSMNPRPPERWRWPCIEALVLAHGRSWQQVAPLPPGVRRGVAKECFKNALDVAREHDELVYVEGWAAFALSRGSLPVEHAWLVDAAGHVVEVTWETPGSEYVGVPIRTARALSLTVRRRKYSVLWAWEIGYPLLVEDPARWLREVV